MYIRSCMYAWKRTHTYTQAACHATHTLADTHTHTRTSEITFCISLTQSHTRAHTRIRTSKHKQAQIKRQHRPHGTPLPRTLSCRSSLAPADISLSATALCPLLLAYISADDPSCRPQETYLASHAIALSENTRCVELMLELLICDTCTCHT